MNGKMILGIVLLIGGLAGIYLVLTGKLPPVSTTATTSTAGVTGGGTTIPGSTSGGTSTAAATQGQKPAGSGGASFASMLASRPFLSPVGNSQDRYLTGVAFK